MDEKDEIRRYMSRYKNEKIKSRNLSEKKRRDQFNMLINELSSMVCPSSRKMDKSSILRATIAFLKNHSELSVQSQNVEVQENWKPPFLSNEEFTHLMLEALDGFIIVFSCNGQILYSSESTASLLGYLPSRIYSSVFDIIHETDKSYLYKLISNAPNSNNSLSKDSYTSLCLYMKRGPIHSQGNNSYELVNLIGTFYHWPSNVEVSNSSVFDCDSNSCSSISSPLPSSGVEWRSCFIAVGRLQTPHLLRVVNLPDDTKNEFTSRHSLEWKFLFLDHRAPPIIGYLPFEVLGTSGYDYYHVDDLDNIAASHELLMQTGEGTSCYYRFLTKGQQWIWLQTRYYISYHQWSSKPEFIVCTHTVVSTEKVLKSMQETPKRYNSQKSNSSQPQRNTPPSQSACISPSPSVSSLGSLSSEHSDKCSAKTGPSNIRVNTVLYSSHGNKEKIVTSPLVRPVPRAAPVIQENFCEPHPNLSVISPSHVTGLDTISSSDRSALPSISSHELRPYSSASGMLATSPGSSVVISTNVSGSQFQGETIQSEMSPEDIEYLSRKYQMLERQILMSQEELKRVSRQLEMARYNRNIMPNSNELSYQTPNVSSASSYVNTYSAPTSSHLLGPISVSTENAIKPVDSFPSSAQSYITSSSYRNLEADFNNIGMSGGMSLVSNEQNNDAIAQSYSMTHSMHPNS